MKEQDYAELNQQTYVKESALALWEGLARLILAGALFALACLPALLILSFGLLLPAILVGILTVSPAWAALNAQVARIIYREPGNVGSFLRAFGKFYLRSLLPGALMAVPLTAAGLTLPLLAVEPVPTQVWMGLAADIAGLFLLCNLYLYAYPILVIYDVSVRNALRNSLVLAARYLGNTLGLLAMAVLLVFIAVKVSTMLLIIFPACWLVFVINNCRMALRNELGDQA